jgi:gamma-glutamyl-gamma-aminobutyrate hydrolase PuuD
MNIGIIPKVLETHKNQFEYSVDIRLINLFKNFFPKCKIDIINSHTKIDKSYKLIVISGGNNLIKFSNKKSDKIRYKLNNKIFKKALRIKIPIMGICYGAQYLALKYYSNFKKINHLKKHFIKLLNGKKILVNSFHTAAISNIGKNLISSGIAYDNTIEYFYHKKKKIFGIMWHPERFIKFRKKDRLIIKKFICN